MSAADAIWSLYEQTVCLPLNRYSVSDMISRSDAFPRFLRVPGIHDEHHAMTYQKPKNVVSTLLVIGGDGFPGAMRLAEGGLPVRGLRALSLTTSKARLRTTSVSSCAEHL